MLAVLGSVADLGGEATLLKIVAQTGLDKKTVSVLLQKAGWEAGVEVRKTGSVYSIESWGPVIREEGALMALRGAAKANQEAA